MKLFEEYKLYESMWDEPEAELKAADFIKNGYKAGTTSFDIYVEDSDKTAAGTYPGMEALDKILEFFNSLSQEEKDAVGLGWYWDVEVPGDAMGDTIVFVAAPSEVEDFTSRSGSNLEAAEMPIRDALGISHAEPNNLKESGVKRLVHKVL